MNYVLINNTCQSQTIEISINSEVVSTYSDLTVLSKQPFGIFAKSLFEALDNELFDDYELEYCATDFQINIIRSQLSLSKFCKKITGSSLNLTILQNNVTQLKSIGNRNHLKCNENRPLKIFSDFSDATEYILGAMVSDIQDADVVIQRNYSFTENGQHYLIGDEYGVINKDGKTVLVFPENDLNLLYHYIYYDYVLLPLSELLKKEISYINLSKKDLVEFRSITTGQPTFYLEGVKNSVDVGVSFPLSFQSFPAGKYVIKSSNPNIVQLTGNMVTAKAEGKATIQVVNEAGEVVDEDPVETVSHQYISEIRLIPQFKYLNINEKNRIDLILVPENAEDADSIRWETNDSDVVQIDQAGNITGLSKGIATITVRGRNVSATIQISVSERIKSISLSAEKVRVRTGSKYTIHCSTNPADAVTDGIEWSFDNPSIATCNPSRDGRSCIITAGTKMEGKGNIRCTDKHSRISAVCPVEVSAKKGGIELIAVLLIILGTIIPYAQIIPFGLGAYGIYRISQKKPLFTIQMCIVAIVLSIVGGVFWIKMS